MKKLIVFGIIVLVSGITCSSFAQSSNSVTEIKEKKSAKKESILTGKKSNKKSDNIRERSLPEYTDQYRKNNGVPEDFPKFINTGNSKLDYSNYHEAKQKWIKEHPAEFEKIKHLHL